MRETNKGEGKVVAKNSFFVINEQKEKVSLSLFIFERFT